MRLLKIIIKDIKSLFTDLKVVGVLILMPVVLTSILGFALAGTFSSNYSIDAFKIAVVKEYNATSVEEVFRKKLKNSMIGQQMGDEAINDMLSGIEEFDIEEIFFEDFLGSEDLEEIMSYDVVSMEEAEKGIVENVYSAIVVLPENFLVDSTLNMLTLFRNEVTITVVKNSSKGVTPTIAEQVIEGFSDMYGTMVISKNVMLESFADIGLLSQGIDQMDVIIESFKEEQEIPEVELVAIEGKKTLDSMAYYSISMMTLFILFSAGQGSTLLLTEKRHGTYQRMIIAGFNPFEIMIGKYFTVFAVAVLQMTIMILYSTFMFDVAWGDALLVILLILGSAFAIAGIGTFFSVLTMKAGNYRIANVLESVVFQTMGLLGGAYIPIEVLPDIFQKLSKFPVNGVALSGFMKVMVGFGFNDIKGDFLILVLNGVLFLSAGVAVTYRERRTQDVGYTEIETSKA